MVTNLILYRGEADDGDPINIGISLPIEFFAEDIGVDFLINELQTRKLHQGLHGFEKRIDAADDRRSGVEDEASAWRQPRQAGLDDPHGKLNTELPPPWR